MIHKLSVRKNHQVVDWEALLSEMSEGKTTAEYSSNRTIFHQGKPADSLFYVRSGTVKLAVISEQGKEAITAVVGPDEFFGEGCLVGQLLRMSSAVALSDCSLARIEKARMERALHEHHEVSELFIKNLLNRNVRYEGVLVDQLFNNCERRLARILLLLAPFSKGAKTALVTPNVSQEHLAQMVGTSRSRVSHFMNRFRKLGFVDYTEDRLTINRGLRSMVFQGEMPEELQ